MPQTGNPFLDWVLLQVPFAIVLIGVVWALVKSGDLAPGSVLRAALEREAKEQARAEKAEASNRAIELLAEQLRRSEARGDEWKEIARAGTITAQRAASVADTVQRQNSGGVT
jgi:hypothetical protein